MPNKFETIFIIVVLVLSLFLVGYYIANERAESKDNYVTGNIIYSDVQTENAGIDPVVINPLISPSD